MNIKRGSMIRLSPERLLENGFPLDKVSFHCGVVYSVKEVGPEEYVTVYTNNKLCNKFLLSEVSEVI